MRCASCGAENPAHARFCLQCGVAVADQPTPGVVAGAGGAERRQLTCLLCDLVSSVELSERLDPEELRETLALYRSVCEKVVRRFGGHIHDCSGDSIMVYFGLPKAHEDDAERAVRSGLGIVEAVGKLSSQVRSTWRVELHVRTGIDTGLVVAGHLGSGNGSDAMVAVGVTPNVAARLQALAEPDSVVVSSATYRIIAGFFDCRELGFRAIRGISQPMAIYQVLHQSGARTRLDIAAQRGLSPMQGRDDEFHALTERWAQAREGHGSVVLVAGEPGIGKSRLIWALQLQAAQSPDAALIRLSCSPVYANTAFHPLTQLLERLLDLGPDDSVDRRLDKIDGLLAQYGFVLSRVAPLLANLLGVPFQDRYAPLTISADRQRQLTIDVLVELALARSKHQPVLLVFEDLQWIDPSSLDVLIRLVDRMPSAREMAVFSFRPEFTPPWDEGAALQRLDLGRLDRVASSRIVTETALVPVPPDLLARLVDKADGVPLYLEELTKLVVEDGLARHDDGLPGADRPSPTLEIPATLADSLTARLDRLAGAKGVAQLGAAIGRQFSDDLLAEVAAAVETVDPQALPENLDRLVDAGLLLVERNARGAVFTFKHALIQDAAYASLLRSTRRRYHRCIAKTLADRFPTLVESAPELLARHYTEAGIAAEAVPCWLQAGGRARLASANTEAIAHLETGMAALAVLPANLERAAQELEFCLALGPAYMAMRGYASRRVEACYHRARELCRELGDPPQLVPVLHGLWTYYIVRARHASALALGEQVLAIGAAAGDDGLMVQGNMETGWSHFFRGELAEAREHLERVLELYDDERHSSHAYVYGDHPATSARSSLAQVLWLLGDVEQALRCSEDNVAILCSLADHPYSVAFGLDLAAFVRQYLGDAAAVRVLVDEALRLSDVHSLALIGAMASILEGWVLVAEGDPEHATARMHSGLSAQLATGAELVRPYWLCLLADASLAAGTPGTGLDLLDEAEAAVTRTGERYWEAEIHRHRGDLILASAHAVTPAVVRTAEASYRRALEVACRQGARSLKLRAALALARLWHGENRGHEASALLTPLYASFSEGRETPDLQEAALLLAELDACAPDEYDGTLPVEAER
jgi:class 3 adenylate cyclase/predicted ATPase